MIFTHPNLSHDVVDGYEFTTATLSNGDTIVARFGAKTTFKRNGRRVARDQAFALVNADAAKLARAGAVEQAVEPLAETPAGPRMSDAQIAESRAAFRQFAELVAETAGVAVVAKAPASPAARLAQIHADIDAANAARLDAAFAASDADPARLSTEGPEFEARRAAAIAQFPELAGNEAAVVADLEERVDFAARNNAGRRVAVEAVDPVTLSGISATELVAQTVGRGVPATPRVIVAALALRMARQGWSVHQLGETSTGYELAASVQPPYGGPIIASADVVDGDLLATHYGPLGDAAPLPREVFIEAVLSTARPA